MIKVQINNICAKLTECEPLTSGMIGKTVDVEFSADWAGLSKTAVFSNGDKTIDVMESEWNGNTIKIPWEVLETPNRAVSFGIYGYTKSGDDIILAIPTLYTSLGRVYLGTNPGGDESTDPSLPVYAQLDLRVTDLEEHGGGIPEAPINGKQYARQDGEWSEVEVGGSGGISATARTLLITILKNCHTETDQRANIDALNEALKQGTATLSSITVAYSGESAAVGTLTADLDIAVTALYSDGSTLAITDGYTLSPSAIVEGANTIAVAYEGKTATFSVTGVIPVAELVSISATYSGEGEYIGTDVTNIPLSVIGHYSDDTTLAISGYTVSGSIANIGDNTLTVAYEGKTTTVVVAGIAAPVVLESITAVFNGADAEVGTSASDLDITVTAHYSDSTSEVVTGWGIEGTVASGENVFTISYGGKTTTVTVIGKVTPDIAFYNKPISNNFDIPDINTVYPITNISPSYTVLLDISQNAQIGGANAMLAWYTERVSASDGTTQKTLNHIRIDGNTIYAETLTSPTTGFKANISTSNVANARRQFAISYDADNAKVDVWHYSKIADAEATLAYLGSADVNLGENLDAASGTRLYSWSDYKRFNVGNYTVNAFELYKNRVITQTEAYAFFNREVSE